MGTKWRKFMERINLVNLECSRPNEWLLRVISSWQTNSHPVSKAGIWSFETFFQNFIELQIKHFFSFTPSDFIFLEKKKTQNISAPNRHSDIKMGQHTKRLIHTNKRDKMSETTKLQNQKITTKPNLGLYIRFIFHCSNKMESNIDRNWWCVRLLLQT